MRPPQSDLQRLAPLGRVFKAHRRRAHLLLLRAPLDRQMVDRRLRDSRHLLGLTVGGGGAPLASRRRRRSRRLSRRRRGVAREQRGGERERSGRKGLVLDRTPTLCARGAQSQLSNLELLLAVREALAKELDVAGQPDGDDERARAEELDELERAARAVRLLEALIVLHLAQLVRAAAPLELRLSSREHKLVLETTLGERLDRVLLLDELHDGEVALHLPELLERAQLVRLRTIEPADLELHLGQREPQLPTVLTKPRQQRTT